MEYPTDDIVVARVVEAFNRHAHLLNLGVQASASLPVKAEDVYEAPMRGGGSPRSADACRQIAGYILWQHVRVWDNFNEKFRPLGYVAIARMMKRSTGAAWDCVRTGCAKVRQPVYATVYSEAIQAMRGDGFDIYTENPVRQC